MPRHRLTIEEMREIARKRGGKCLSGEYIGCRATLRWKCEHGHVWEATPSSIKGGSWCPRCKHLKRRLTIGEMRKLAESKGGKCLSMDYGNAFTDLTWECEKGHVWEATPTSIKHGGNWCPYCAGRRKTIEDMQGIAERSGGKCLSERYVDSKTKLKWQCSKGHVWEALPSSVKRGSWCPYCANRRGSLEQARRVAGEKGGKCLSKDYVNSTTKLKWRCAVGHEFERSLAWVNAGRWCRECYLLKMSDSIEDMRDIAKRKGGNCLSEEYVNQGVKLRWQCEKGHVWEAAPSSVKYRSWCPYCAGLRKGIGDMQALAAERNGKCLSERYVNCHTKLKWQCEKGHVWEAKPTKIKSGIWCPKCAREKRKLTMEDMMQMAEIKGGKCLSEDYVGIHTKLKWQCSKGHVWEAAPASVRIGNWCPYCVGRNKTVDDLRRMAKERGGRLLSKKYLGVAEKHRWRCANGHVWEATPSAVQQGSWCTRCARDERNRKVYEELSAIAKDRGGRCLSKEYLGLRTKMIWRCSIGHVWEAAPGNIKSGHWCPNCVNRKHTIEEMKDIAIERGGQCLSTEFHNVDKKLTWKCEKGHVWEGKPSRVLNGSWCPKCMIISRRLGIGEMRKMARERGGKCLSDKYVNQYEKLRWQCSLGHVWEAAPAGMRSKGRWCPECTKEGAVKGSIKKKRRERRPGPTPRYTIKDMQEMARRWNGHCISKEYVDEDFELAWVCSRGHSWTDTPKNIRKGKWCPDCRARRRR